MDYLSAYSMMYRIRHTEEEIARRYSEQKMRTPTHLSIGQESVPVALAQAGIPADRWFSNHRCHAHYLAKGGSVEKLIAELYGKSTGAAGGIGGSMHLVDDSVNFMGTSAIVGSSISVALGTAMALKKTPHNENRVIVFLGDAGPETGQFYEAINMAALWRLPIVFVCENNGYATQTPLSARQPKREFWRVAESMGINGYQTHTDQFEHVHNTGIVATTNTPSYFEIPTYRFREHVGPTYDHNLGYRSREEVIEAEGKDPLKKLRDSIEEKYEGRITEADINKSEALINVEIASAFKKAEEAEWPQS